MLSRADEVGSGRLDAMDAARRVAARLAADPDVRRLVQDVVPVAGLLAETGATLTEDEFRQLGRLAAQPPDDLARQLLSADRFAAEVDGVAVDGDERRALLLRFGVFGIRLATSLLRDGGVTSATALAAALREHSGLEELRDLLGTVFVERADVLKARSTLDALEGLLRRTPPPDPTPLAVGLERLVASTHAFAELRTVEALRAGGVRGKPAELATAERLLGAHGRSPATRLALPVDADAATIAAAAAEALARWQRRAESPLASHALQAAARVVVRSCEQLVVDAGDAT